MHLLKVLSDFFFFDQSMAFHYNKISEAGNFLKKKKKDVYNSPFSRFEHLILELFVRL